ncbi:pyruvate dehydrogenase complex dihydrolipoamide acetyltransferase [Salegentibacter sp. HM20]
MAEVINMPRLSDTMEEGVVAKWLKKKGDKVEEGDILAEIETDKATMEFESFYEGTLLHIGIEEGETAPVDSLLAIIGEEGEDISDLLEGGSDSAGNGKEEKSSEEKEDKESSKEEEETEETSEEGEIPEGVEVINMPRLSDTMEEGTVASWLKQEGDKVEEGDILAEIETDKATMEFESFYSGTLLKIGIQEGETAKVDSLLAIIGPEGTDVSKIGSGTSKKKSSAKKEEKKEEPKKEEKSTSEASSEDKKSGGRIFASPLAKKMAEDKGIDLNDVKGSGENGRIVKKDIEDFKPSEKPAAAAQESVKEAKAAAPQAYMPAGEESFEEVKNSQMRKTIAKRLGESKFTAPHYYLTIEVDMENAMASRKQINELPDVKVSFNDMVIKASAMALRKHPQVNSQWTGDSTKIAKHIHMGVAVAVEEGLVVPVLKFADQMSMTQIGGNVKELAGKARNKKLQPQEMEGSTFTVSNLGMFGIVEFTSIINQPNSAILSVGAIVEKPVVKNGQIVVGNTMTMTLACDHRTVDGATGAAFLQTLKTYLENPVTMLA